MDENGLNKVESRKPSANVDSIKPKSSRNNLSEESVAYWQTERLTYEGAVEEVRKSYRESLHAKDFFKNGKEYMIKNIELQRRSSLALGNSLRFVENNKGQMKSSYNLPSNVFERNTNFNDFYAAPQTKRSQDRRTSIQDNLKTFESKENTEVENVSHQTAHDSEEFIFRLKNSEATIQNIVQLFKLKQERPEKKKSSPTRRLSGVCEANLPKEVKKLSKEDDLKYQIYHDLEKTISNQKEDSDKSLNSLTHVSIKRGQRGTLKKGFSMAAAMYLSKMISRANTIVNPEYKGLKKSAIKRLQKKDPITRQTSMTTQNQFKFTPQFKEVNKYRTFGKLCLPDKITTFKNPVGQLHYSTIFNGEESPSKRIYSSYWLGIIERLLKPDDLKEDSDDVGYYTAISHLVEESSFTLDDFSEIYNNHEKQDMSTAISLYQKLSKDIEFEDEELDIKKETVLVEPYKYLNADTYINPFVKSALNKMKSALNIISKIVDNESFKETVFETVSLYFEYPL